MEPLIRPAVDADIDAVASIYAREVEVGYATLDTEPPPRSSWEARLASTHPGDHFLVLEVDGVVAGYAYSGTYNPRGAYGRSRGTTIYLAPRFTGRGLGRRLYDDLLARLQHSGMHTALTAIALPNEASEALHRACGFEPVGIMREVGHKFGRWIDVVWMQKMLD